MSEAESGESKAVELEKPPAKKTAKDEAAKKTVNDDSAPRGSHHSRGCRCVVGLLCFPPVLLVSLLGLLLWVILLPSK